MKPINTLTQLEEEPETGFFSCTATEIGVALRRGLIIAGVATVLLSFIISWEIAGILSMVIGALVFYISIKRFSKNRADKPLYYHKHLATHKTHQFIHPARKYQRERNAP